MQAKMEKYIQNIVKYIKKNLAKGYTLESLKWALLNQGYSRTSVDNAIKLTNEELSKEAPLLKEKPKITVEREPFYEETKPKSFWKKFKEFFKS